MCQKMVRDMYVNMVSYMCFCNHIFTHIKTQIITQKKNYIINHITEQKKNPTLTQRWDFVINYTVNIVQN